MERRGTGPGRGGKANRATGALTNIAVLERELGSIEYRLWKAARPDPALRARRNDLLRMLDEENARLARLRGEQEARDRGG